MEISGSNYEKDFQNGMCYKILRQKSKDPLNFDDE